MGSKQHLIIDPLHVVKGLSFDAFCQCQKIPTQPVVESGCYLKIAELELSFVVILLY